MRKVHDEYERFVKIPRPDEDIVTYITDDNILFPKLSAWNCYLFGTGPEGITFRPRKGCEPNFFWRWMQYLCFGNKWVKDDKRA